jgi:hypothetical protein
MDLLLGGMNIEVFGRENDYAGAQLLNSDAVYTNLGRLGRTRLTLLVPTKPGCKRGMVLLQG